MRKDGMNVAVNAVKLDADEIERALLRFVGEEVAADADGLAPDENLIGTGRIDSLGLLNLLAYIQAQWHVDLMGAGSPRDLVSVATMAAAVHRARGGADRVDGA